MKKPLDIFKDTAAELCNTCGSILEKKFYTISSLDVKFCTKLCVYQYIKDDIKLGNFINKEDYL